MATITKQQDSSVNTAKAEYRAVLNTQVFSALNKWSTPDSGTNRVFGYASGGTSANEAKSGEDVHCKFP